MVSEYERIRHVHKIHEMVLSKACIVIDGIYREISRGKVDP